MMISSGSSCPDRSRRTLVAGCAILTCLSLSSALLVGACGSSNPPEQESPPSASPPGYAGATDASAPGTTGGDSTGAADGGAAADVASVADLDASGGGPSADSAGPYIDAPLVDRHSGDTCNSKWWATSSAFDGTVTPSSFASAVNPIVGSSSIHPFTLVMQVAEDGGWTGAASGTATDGSGNQYFPSAAAATPTSMLVTSTSIATVTPETSAWLHLHDAGGNDLWIPIAGVALSANYGDPGCATLVGGVLTAVIQASVSSTSIQPIGEPPTTLGALLGPQTSLSPAGWNVRMTFEAASVQVD